MAIINLGQVAYVNKGKYDHDSLYKKHDVILFCGGSYVYTYDTAATGISPTDSSHWKAILDPNELNTVIDDVCDLTEQCNAAAEQAVFGLLINGVELPKNEEQTIHIPIATSNTNGAMAAEDKALLNMLENHMDIAAWDDIAIVVRNGAGKYLFPVGTQLTSEKVIGTSATVSGNITTVTVDTDLFVDKMGGVSGGGYTFLFSDGVWQYQNQQVSIGEYGITVSETAQENDTIIVTELTQSIPWDVVHHGMVQDIVTGEDKPGMVLLMHSACENVQFDNNEALYYVSEDVWPEGMPPGTYNFTTRGSIFPWDTPGTYVFTTTKAVPVGGQIEAALGSDYPPILTDIFTYINGTTLSYLERLSLISGNVTDGIHLGTDGNVKSFMNNINRSYFGSDNYAECAARQWINSAEEANKWWKPQTIFDRRPFYLNVPGFLKDMDARFLAAVGTTQVKCRTNSKFEVYPEMPLPYDYYVQDKFFLPSLEELGDLNSPNAWDAYKGAINQDRVKYAISKPTTACQWWVRETSGLGYGLFVLKSGGIGMGTVNGGFAVAPACIIC